MRLVLTVAVVLATVAAAAPASAHPPGSGKWSWTPALCKSELKRYGVRIDDGRTFRATTVFCAGMPECVYDRSDRKHYYDHFAVAMIDGNLVYRTLKLHITAKDNFRVDQLKVHGRATTTAEVSRFKREAQTLIARIARQTQADCTIEP